MENPPCPVGIERKMKSAEKKTFLFECGTLLVSHYCIGTEKKGYNVLSITLLVIAEQTYWLGSKLLVETSPAQIRSSRQKINRVYAIR
jgi:hypothetical protein